MTPGYHKGAGSREKCLVSLTVMDLDPDLDLDPSHPPKSKKKNIERQLVGKALHIHHARRAAERLFHEPP